MADDAVEDGARYWAFISYSHKDATFGRRLHRRLENYALPRRLAGRATPRGIVPRRLTPIFRDREELPAAHDLSFEVRAALAASRSLIVVCSPSAAASPWVSREVELFRTLHPDRPILAALAKGEPSESFPQALRGTLADGTIIEPLAADFRREGDGAQAALLKLVAGIAGIGLDELVQRDAQRNLQRVTAVTATALLAMLVMGLLTIFAFRARKEAELQRAGAERLVEYMLTDLRRDLKGVGRLDVMRDVNAELLKFYAAQDISHLPVDSLEHRARVLDAMGEDDEKRGNLDLALGEFREASRSTAALLAEDPNKPDRIFAQAQSEYWVALVDWRRGNFAAARKGFERYAALAGRLLRIDPANPDWHTEAGDAQSNLGTLALDRYDVPEAERCFADALSHFLAALHAKPHDPDALGDVADAYGWVADSQRTRGAFDLAHANRTRERIMLVTLQATDPQNAEYASYFLGNTLGFAHIELDQGHAAAADVRLTAARADAARLATADPKNQKLAKQKIAVDLFLAKAKLVQRLPQDARPLLAGCTTQIAKDDIEIADFCAVLSAGAARAAGTYDSAAEAYLRANRPRMEKIRHSPRWGIDFQKE